MKRLFFYLLPCLLLATLVGCTDESAGNEPGQPGAPEAFRLAVRVPGSSIASRAAGATETGSDYENRINTFSLFVFEEKKGTGGATDTTCLFCQRIDLTQPSAETGGWVTDGSDETLKNMTIPISASAGWENLPLDVSATYHFYLLANVPEDNDPALPHKEAPADITVGLLRSMEWGNMNLLNLNSQTSPSTDGNNRPDAIPMAGYSEVTQLSSTMPPIAIALTRMVSKVRFTVQVSPAFAAEYTPDLSGSEAALRKGSTSGYLLDSWQACGLPKPNVIPLDEAIRNTGFSGNGLSGWFYVDENLPDASAPKPAHPTVFNLSVPTLKDGLTETHTYVIPVNDSLALRRNTIYNMLITLIGPGSYTTDNVETTTQVLPWNVQASELEDGMTVKVLINMASIIQLPALNPYVVTAHVMSENSYEVHWYFDGKELMHDGSKVVITDAPSTTEEGYRGHTLSFLPDRLEDSGTISVKVRADKHYNYRSHTTQLTVQGVAYQPADAPYMQEWEPPHHVYFGQTYLLRDKRDNKVYRIKLMYDGQWWMVENLHYWPGLAKTSPDDYNAVAKSSQYDAEHDLYGTCYSDGRIWLYNFEAATQKRLQVPLTGMTGNGPEKYTNRIQGLCPDGWHLPTAGGRIEQRTSELGCLIYQKGFDEEIVSNFDFGVPGTGGDLYQSMCFMAQVGYIRSNNTPPLSEYTEAYISSCQAEDNQSCLVLFRDRENRNLRFEPIPHYNGVSIRCIRNYQ